MSKLNIDMIREIKNNHPAVPEPFLNESKLLDVEEDCRKAFLSSRTGRLGAFGRAFHSFIEAPSGDLVSAYILAIDSEDERKADVLLRFYTAPGERAVLLYRDTIAFVSETMPEPGDTVTVKSSREFSKDVMLNHETQVASYIERTGNSVLYKVAPDFRDNELMARGVRIQAQSVDSQDDELSFDVYCYNVQPGYALDYLTGAASKG